MAYLVLSMNSLLCDSAVVSPMMERRTLSVSNHVDGEPLGPDEDADSTHTTPNNGGMELRPSHSLGPVDKAAELDAHTQALHTFLVAHADNIRNLQDALLGSPPNAVAKPVVHGKLLVSTWKYSPIQGKQFNSTSSTSVQTCVR